MVNPVSSSEIVSDPEISFCPFLLPPYAKRTGSSTRPVSGMVNVSLSPCGGCGDRRAGPARDRQVPVHDDLLLVGPLLDEDGVAGVRAVDRRLDIVEPLAAVEVLADEDRVGVLGRVPATRPAGQVRERVVDSLPDSRRNVVYRQSILLFDEVGDRECHR